MARDKGYGKNRLKKYCKAGSGFSVSGAPEKAEENIITSSIIVRLAAILLCLTVFFILLRAVNTGSASAVDEPVREVIYGLRSEGLTIITTAITYMGNWQTITLLCIVLLLIGRTRAVYGVPVSAGAILVTVINKLIKEMAARERPDAVFHLIEQGGWSFPSGHSATSMCVFAVLIYLVRTNMQNRRAANTLTVLLSLPMVLIGISRIYLGVHYPTDVLAGWCIGLVIAYLLMICDICLRNRNAKPQGVKARS